MSTPADRLKAHIRANAKSRKPFADFAQELRVDQTTLSRYLSGMRRPAPPIRERIYHLTGIDLYELPDLPQETAP